jgi:hypothetical protein
MFIATRLKELVRTEFDSKVLLLSLPLPVVMIVDVSFADRFGCPSTHS